MERMLKAISVTAKRSLKRQNPRSTRPQRAETSVSDARHQDDALLTEISQDFDQDEDIGPNINQQLADIIIKRW